MVEREHPDVEDRLDSLVLEYQFWEDFLDKMTEDGAVSESSRVYAKNAIRNAKINLREVRETVLLLENYQDKEHGIASLLALFTDCVRFGYIVGAEVRGTKRHEEIRKKHTEKSRSATTINRQSRICDFIIRKHVDEYRSKERGQKRTINFIAGEIETRVNEEVAKECVRLGLKHKPLGKAAIRDRISKMDKE